MKILKLIAFALLAFGFSTTKSFSQGTFSYHFGPSIPAGNFADDEGSHSGSAGLGLDFGLQYDYPMSENGLGLFAGIDITYNGLKKSVRDDQEDALSEEFPNNNFDITFPKYLNLPVSGGLKYQFKVNEKVSIYGKGGLVASFLKITNTKISEGSEELTSKYDLSSTLGYTIGGGFKINDKMDLSLTYFGLGDHDISGEMNNGHGETQKLDKEKVSVGFTTLTLGFKF